MTPCLHFYVFVLILVDGVALHLHALPSQSTITYFCDDQMAGKKETEKKEASKTPKRDTSKSRSRKSPARDKSKSPVKKSPARNKSPSRKSPSRKSPSRKSPSRAKKPASPSPARKSPSRNAKSAEKLQSNGKFPHMQLNQNSFIPAHLKMP